MAKVTEGDPYYYAPSMYINIQGDDAVKADLYCVFKKGVHPNQECIAVDVSQDNASLIVDALNFHHDALKSHDYGVVMEHFFLDHIKDAKT